MYTQGLRAQQALIEVLAKSKDFETFKAEAIKLLLAELQALHSQVKKAKVEASLPEGFMAELEASITSVGALTKKP